MIPTQVKKVIYRAPAILGLNLDINIRSKVEYLQSTLDLSNDELHTILAAMPSLLLLNSEGNLQPKIEYLSSVLSSSSDIGTNRENTSMKNEFLISSSSVPVPSIVDQLREIVLRLPTLLGYSLEQRIIPRVQAIMNAGLHPFCITIGIPMTQPAFDQWLRRRAIKYPNGAMTMMNQPSQTIESSKNTPPFLLPGTTKGTSLTVSKQSNSDDSEGRIVHWVRERRPRQNP
jgi:mTERF domain-containing protein